MDVIRSRAQASRLRHITKPLIVLSASEPYHDHLGGPAYSDTAADIARWRAQQASATALSANAIQVIAGSGHVVQQDNPKAAVAAVRTLLNAVESGKRLRCGRSWQTLQARCSNASELTAQQ